jgi:hypothetical protein
MVPKSVGDGQVGERDFGLVDGNGGEKDWAMPQIQLPIFPVGTSAITAELGFERRDQQVVYLNGHLPVFTHEVDDLASFRFFTTQLIINGTATQSQIVKAFGVPLTTVKRCCRQYRERGGAAFFKPAAIGGSAKHAGSGAECAGDQPPNRTAG